MLSRTLLTVALATFSIGHVLETTPALPKGWHQLPSAPNASSKLRLSFALRQPSLEDIGGRINSRSHVSHDEARALQVPDQQDTADVLQWLEESGMHHVSAEKGWVQVHTTVAEAEKLLDMKLGRFAYEDKKPVLRTRSYSVPDALTQAIRFVHPISNFMAPRNDLSSPSPPSPEEQLLQRAGEGCVFQTDPACLQQQYNIPKPDHNCSCIRFGVAGFLEEYANYQDVADFLSVTNFARPGYNFTTELVNGGANSQDLTKSGAEAALDMQYAVALGFPTDITYYSTGGRGVQLNDTGKPFDEEFATNEPYLELLEHLLAKSDDEIPHVLSISYADDELSVPRPYADKVCSLLGLLTARGTSILSGSGDGGARGGRSSNCRTNDGTNRDVAMSTFPASCPWITSVGAVTNASPLEGAGFSSGGFSQYFERPKWQDEAVETYVDVLAGQMKGYYNKDMRAVPDISVIGTRFMTIIKGQRSALEGTSASTPLLAAMIALVDDERVRQGKNVLGWLNERLYSPEVRAVLEDVTAGNSTACMFQNGEMGGWPAGEGWDAITGLGVPSDFQAFLKVLVEME